MRGRSGPLGGRVGVLKRSTVLLLVAGIFFLNLAMVSLWAWRTFASSQGFADTTTDMLKEPAVREVLVDRIVDGLEQNLTTAQVAVNARVFIEPAVVQLVATDAFQGVFHAAVRELHSELVEGSRSSLVVPVDDAADLVRQNLEVANPTIADAIPQGPLDLFVGISQSTPVDTAIRVASLAGWLAGPFAVISLACLALVVRRARDRRRALELIGLGMVALGVAHFAMLAVGLQITANLGDTERERTALRAVYWSVGHVLNVQAKVVITAGLVIAIAAAHAGTGQIRTRLIETFDRIAAALSRPGWRALGCAALIAGGYFAMRWPEASTAIVIRTLAVAAFLAGAVGLLDVIGSVNWTEPAPERYPRAVRRTAAGASFGIAAVSVTMLFGGLALVRALRAPDADHLSMAEAGCNGHIELCDRRLDEVVFAGTHNSMAASRNPGFITSRQVGGIGAQLLSGVRAFLMDMHYGVRSDTGFVRTDFRSEREEELAATGLSEDEREARDRAFQMMGVASDADDRRDVYLCHLYCELGALPAADTFRMLHDFLRENPNEVIVLVLEDEVAPADAIDALEHGGLADRALVWSPGSPLPTLGEMIQDHHNVVVLAENEGGAESWYIDAFDMVQDTQYDVPTAEDFSCARLRGTPASPLFMLNHWVAVDPPDPATAATVNAEDFLLARAQRCAAERKLTPNIVAVDFYSFGDLFDVVRELNGVD
jgi:hypothetical protein